MPDEHDIYARVKAEVPRNVQRLEECGYTWNDDFGWFEKPHPEGLIWMIELEKLAHPSICCAS
jgi:hypothetical protein